MASAATQAGAFTRIVEQLQAAEQTQFKIGWNGCGVRALRKDDVTTVRRVGSHELKRGNVLLYRCAAGLRFGRLLQVVVCEDGRYYDILDEESSPSRIRLKPASVAGKIVEARRGDSKVSLSWSWMENLRHHFGRAAADKPQ
ncbi:MAG: hypothetical protein ACYCW6_29845 [Candidatus Xenobia bacterium]